MTPYVPKYVSPKQAAEDRARLRASIVWIALILFAVLGLLAFGYSDQAPAGLRAATTAVDRALGYPIAFLISMLAR